MVYDDPLIKCESRPMRNKNNVEPAGGQAKRKRRYGSGARIYLCWEFSVEKPTELHKAVVPHFQEIIPE